MKQMINVRVGEPFIDNYRYNGRKFINYRCCEYVDVETSVDYLIESLLSIKESYPEYSNLSIARSNDCGCYNDCNCSPTYYIHGMREETDLEYNFRIEKEASDALKNEEAERAAYEKLKSKFEKG